jgi:eukaryotic-like serine/threonine-protein kinase
LPGRNPIEDLFERYLEARELTGTPPTPEELCRDAPELLPALRELIAEHRRIEEALRSETVPPSGLPAGGTLARFRILEKVAAGGMGVVYRAEDPSLGRLVALKLLSPANGAWDERSRERFLREARAASALDHPNICTIYEIGESSDGQLFIAMPFYEGETLAARLGRGPLSPDEALRIAVQIAEGLARAHGSGIVHRDLKPANLFLTADGIVKILDFGLAKRLGQDDLTRSGALLGTASYMSPEQARGRPSDARSDVWACGVLLHEMLTGRPPFIAESSEALLYAIVHETPGASEQVPQEIRPIVRRALAKDPAERFPDAAALLVELRDLQRRKASGPAAERPPVPSVEGSGSGRPSARRIAYAGAAILALVVLVSVLMQRAGDPRRAATAGGVDGGSAPIPSLAVLPFENLGPAEQQHFAEGMTEAITTHLAKIEALKVISRSAVHRYRTDRPKPSQIARELGVASLVEGSALLAGERVRITAQLVDGASDRHLWAESYEGDLRDVLALQSRVARAIAREVRARVTPDEERRLAVSRVVDSAAYEIYLEGRLEYQRALATDEHMFPSLRRSIERLRVAVELEPEWSAAHGALADSFLRLAGMSDDHSERLDSYRAARASAERAVDLDPTNARARMVLGRTLLFLDWDWEGAEREYAEAIRLAPNEVDWHFGRHLAWAGRFDEALARFRYAQERFPASTLLVYQIGEALVCKGDLDGALQEARKLRERLGDTVHAVLLEAEAASRRGRFTEAVDLLESHREALLVNRATTFLQGHAYAAAKAGRVDLAQRSLRELESLGGRPTASVLLALGDREAARRTLEEHFRQRDYALLSAPCWVEYENLRRLPGVDLIFDAAAPPVPRAAGAP